MVFALGACGLDELGALLEADRSVFGTPSLRAPGQFSDVRVVYSTKHHALAVALNHDEPTPRLSITPLLGTTCFAGPARRFEVSSTAEETGLVAATQGDSLGDPAPIRVVTYDCDEVLELPEARWVSSYFGGSSSPGMTFVTALGSVVFIEETGVVHEIASEADQVYGVGSEVWALADDQLRRWTSPFAAPTSWSGVDEVVSDRSRLAFSGDDGVHFVLFDHITRLTDEGCRLTLIDGGLSFESPCGSQRTVAHAQIYRYEPPPDEPWPGSVVGFPVSVEPSEVQIFSDAREFYYYLRLNVDSDGIADLIAVTGRDGWPTVIGTRHRRTRSGICVDWDGSAGRLISPRFTTNGDRLSVSSIRTIASNVAEHLGRAFLVDFDGSTGELRSPDGLRVYGREAPPQELVGPPGAVLRAFLADYDGTSGNLYVLEDPEATPQVVANDVALGTVQFLNDGSAALYLTEPRSGSGTLRAHLFDAEVEQTIAAGVSEFVVELGGVVYAVRSGDAPGLYWTPRR